MEEGDGGGIPRPGVERREQHKKPFLPLDMVLEIAARSDPATLVRCAATCREARRRVAGDGSFHRRLRLRHAKDGRFVPSLLRGHLVALDRHDHCGRFAGFEVHLVDVDVTAAAAPGTAARSRRLSAAEGFPPHPDGDGGKGKPIMRHRPLSWRDGLFLVRTNDDYHDRSRGERLRVCDPATDRSQTLPPEPTFPGEEEKRNLSRWHTMAAERRWQPYVLLGCGGGGGGDGDDGEVVVGGGEASSGIIGRPFQVLKANLVMSKHHRYLETQTFSSESGTWGAYAELRVPHFHGSKLLQQSGGRPLVAGDAVHWLCITDAASYVLRLNIGPASTTPAQVTVTTLPASFPRPSNKVCDYRTYTDYLLATATAGAGGSLMVLVADSEKISAWVQVQTAATAKWKPRPEVVVEYEEILRFRRIAWSATFSVKLHWFAERSGFLLVDAGIPYGFFLLDLRSSSPAIIWRNRFCSVRDGSVILGCCNIY